MDSGSVVSDAQCEAETEPDSLAACNQDIECADGTVALYFGAQVLRLIESISLASLLFCLLSKKSQFVYLDVLCTQSPGWWITTTLWTMDKMWCLPGHLSASK